MRRLEEERAQEIYMDLKEVQRCVLGQEREDPEWQESRKCSAQGCHLYCPLHGTLPPASLDCEGTEMLAITAMLHSLAQEPPGSANQCSHPIQLLKGLEFSSIPTDPIP